MGNKSSKNKKGKQKTKVPGTCCTTNCYQQPLKDFIFEFQHYYFTEKHLDAIKTCLKPYNISDVSTIIAQYLKNLSNEKYNCQSLAHESLCKTKLCKQMIDLYCYKDYNFNSRNTNKEIKTVIVGNGGVGKSAITIRFVADNFLEEYDPTIEDSYLKAKPLFSPNEEYTVVYDILDTAGREEFSALRDQWIRESQLFIFVYDITSPYTLQDGIIHHMKHVLRIKEDELDNMAMVLVCNKIDLRNENDKFITAEEGIKLAMEYKIPYIETSAKENININYLFNCLLFEYLYQSNVTKDKRVCNIKLG